MNLVSIDSHSDENLPFFSLFWAQHKVYYGIIPSIKGGDFLSNYRKGISIGVGIEVLGIIYAVLCVWKQIQVPVFVSFTILTGIIITLSVSFAAIREDQRDSSHKKPLTPMAAWIVFALLAILTLWLTMSSAFGL